MDQRLERTVKVVNPLGLHARAAALLVKATARMPCEVTLECDGQEVNGKSIMGVLTLAAAQGCDVKIVCDGEGAGPGMEAIVQLFEAGFHEMKP
jgi:phosphocarrier protein HPr